MNRITLTITLAVSLVGCALFAKTVRTVRDLAELACEMFAADHEDELKGVSPADFCAAEENLKPFIDQIAAAQQTAGAEVGLGQK